jgi:hypothetical protein
MTFIVFPPSHDRSASSPAPLFAVHDVTVAGFLGCSRSRSLAQGSFSFRRFDPANKIDGAALEASANEVAPAVATSA